MATLSSLFRLYGTHCLSQPSTDFPRPGICGGILFNKKGTLLPLPFAREGLGAPRGL